VDTVQHPPTMPGITRNVRPGLMNRDDLEDYNIVLREPVATTYRGLSIYGMGPPSSGGSTIGESLNILEGFDMHDLSRTQALHLYDRANRRQRDGRPRAWLPAEQRAHRLRSDARAGQFARTRQAAAQQHEPDHRLLGWPAGAGTGFTGRLNDHHYGPAAPDQSGRLRHVAT